MQYLWQITETRPNGWHTITADTPEDAAIEVAKTRCAIGRQVVNIASAKKANRYPNGAPMVNHRFDLEVFGRDTTKTATI